MGLSEKLLAIQSDVMRVKKNGFNSFHGYHYVTEDDLLSAVKASAIAHGVLITCRSTSEIGCHTTLGKNELVRWAKVTIMARLEDLESEDVQETSFDGYAEDKGDKAIYKATTGAYKYFLMKFFGVATGDDPELPNAMDKEAVAAAPPPQKPKPPTDRPKQSDPGLKEAHESLKAWIQTLGISPEQAKALNGGKSMAKATEQEVWIASGKFEDLAGRKLAGKLTDEEWAIIHGDF